MASEIYLRHGRTSETLYFTVTAENETIWNGSALVSFAVASWTSYDQAMTETPASSYRYVGDFPALLDSAGDYIIEIYEQQGGSPAITDPKVGIGTYTVGETGGSFSSPDGWPDADDLEAFLIGAGLLDDPPTSAQSQIDLSLAIAAAVEQFERDTGYQPFIASADDSTRTFDPPGSLRDGLCRGGDYLLDLQGGLVSFTSLSVGGTAYTNNEDFYLSPNNATARGQAWTYIEFISRVYGAPRSISATGKWGRVADGQLPADAFQAVLQGAAASVAEALQSLRTSGGASRLKQYGVEVEYGSTTSQKTQAQGWMTYYQSVARKYRRVSFA